MATCLARLLEVATIYAIINSTIIMWKDERKWLTCYAH